jgi:DNA-binding phage protein
MEQGVDRKEAMHEVARAAGVPKREVFDALLDDR